MALPDADAPPQWGFAILTLLLGLGVALGVAEGLARTQALPRVQHVDLGEVDGRLHEGVPLWRSGQDPDGRAGLPCEGRPEVLLLGSSIFFGSGVETHESLTPALQARLPDWCVRNLAQPAYTFMNQAAELELHLDRSEAPPQVVVWELWTNSLNRWLLRGEQAYNFSSLAPLEPEVPNPLGLPPSLHLPLFDRLAAYRHLVVRRASPNRQRTYTERMQVLGQEQLSPAVDRLRAQDSRVILALLPGLDAPFAETARSPDYLYEPVVQAVGDRVELLPVAAGLAGKGLDHRAIRFDACCHYNAAGLEAVADLIAAAVGPPIPVPADGAEALSAPSPE